MDRNPPFIMSLIRNSTWFIHPLTWYYRKLINAIEPGTVAESTIKKEDLPGLLKYKKGVRMQDTPASEPDEYIFKKNIIIETSLRKANELPNPIINKKITNTAGPDYSGTKVRPSRTL